MPYNNPEIFLAKLFSNKDISLHTSTLKPIQIVFGLPGEAGATFFMADDVSLIGEADDSQAVLQIAHWCNGGNTLATIHARARVAGLSPQQTDLILEILYAEAIVVDAHALPSTATPHPVQQANGLLRRLVGPQQIVAMVTLDKHPGDGYPSGSTFPFETCFIAEAHLNAPSKKQTIVHGVARDPAKACSRALIKALVYGEESPEQPLTAKERGVNPTQTQARQQALFALIKGDALAIAWHTHAPVTTIPLQYSPETAQKNIKAWARYGREVKLLNLTLDSLPVILALSEGDRYPFIGSGSAAGLTYSAAICEALAAHNEQVLIHLYAPQPPPSLATPLLAGQQAHLYTYPGNEYRLDWLLTAPAHPPAAPSPSLKQVARQFNLTTVPRYTPQFEGDMWVVEAVSPALLPQRYGYSSGLNTHPRFAQRRLTQEPYSPYPPPFT